MKHQVVKKTVINKQTLLFYRLESGLYTQVVERSGMSWGSFLTLEEAEAFALRYVQGGERCIKTGGLASDDCSNPYKAHLWRPPMFF